MQCSLLRRKGTLFEPNTRITPSFFDPLDSQNDRGNSNLIWEMFLPPSAQSGWFDFNQTLERCLTGCGLLAGVGNPRDRIILLKYRRISVHFQLRLAKLNLITDNLFYKFCYKLLLNRNNDWWWHVSDNIYKNYPYWSISRQENGVNRKSGKHGIW
jgi:hypothetical protein